MQHVEPTPLQRLLGSTSSGVSGGVVECFFIFSKATWVGGFMWVSLIFFQFRLGKTSIPVDEFCRKGFKPPTSLAKVSLKNDHTVL